jgi:hypothetical protein
MFANRFVGHWRLVYCEYVSPDGRTLYPLGHAPHGTMTFDAEGRIEVTLDEAVVALTHGDTQQVSSAAGQPLLPPPDMTGRDLTFTGRYEVAGNYFIHHIDTSTVPAWSGSSSRRSYAFRKNRLITSVDDARLPGELSFIWERIAAAD